MQLSTPRLYHDSKIEPEEVLTRAGLNLIKKTAVMGAIHVFELGHHNYGIKLIQEVNSNFNAKLSTPPSVCAICI